MKKLGLDEAEVAEKTMAQLRACVVSNNAVSAALKAESPDERACSDSSARPPGAGRH